ncbi:MAG: proline iminopeptidase-family hydrolase [Lachnospiraceae bacterium]|nr:proline iminopeptidase-family hydrolase [Lachnospiraceae bacterium]
MQIKEGYIPFMGFKTYYRIAEAENSDLPPVLLLHGGPGSTHNYMEIFDCFAEEGRTMVTYDQIGCGNSYVDGHPELWKMETWISELTTIRNALHLEKCHILGQSWGGMLLLQYLISCHPEGVISAVLSSTLPSSQLWGSEQHRILRYFPKDEQDAIKEAERTGNYTTRACQKATEHFMSMRCASAPTPNDPEYIRKPKRIGTESYVTAWGNNEYTPSGTLQDFDVREELKNINIPSLILSGTDDLCTPLIAKTMHDRIPNSSWYLFEGVRHMCYLEKPEIYMPLLKKWLKACDEGNIKRDFISNSLK